MKTADPNNGESVRIGRAMLIKMLFLYKSLKRNQFQPSSVKGIWTSDN